MHDETCASSSSRSVAAGIKLTPKRLKSSASQRLHFGRDPGDRLAHHAEKAEGARGADRGDQLGPRDTSHPGRHDRISATEKIADGPIEGAFHGRVPCDCAGSPLDRG